MAPHFRWFLKLLFLLQMLARAPTIDTRPASGAPQSELIAGNEFLKLFLERDELQRDLHSGEYQQGRKASGSGSDVAGDADADGDRSAGHFDNSDANEANGQAVGRATAVAARSVGPKSRNGKRNANADDDGKPVVKLVTSGSKIVFLEEYDDNDAVVDAVAREIDLQKENVRKAVAKAPSELQKQRQQQQQQLQQKSHKTNPGDEVKVVAVSVSSSSKRTNAQVARKQGNKLSPMSTHAGQASAHADIMRQAHKTAPQPHDSSTASTFRASAVPKEQLTLTTAAPTTTTRGDFVNRSHKSEFSIEEAEPLTMSQRQAARAMSAAFVDALDEVDSENSASTNIHNVLAAPLVQSASTRSTATMAVAYHSGNQNASTSLHINHSPSGVHAHVSTHDTSAQAADASVSAPAGEVDDEKLLPFQTVIYHDTKEGRGPQSRSISYSSLSQNVDDLHRWRQSGILAEAQRNVSESLKPAEHSAVAAHNSEPAKFYSVPSKMYGEPAKFYSEPAKVYSEPAKVYGQPEKFYSEPAKVYSQPSKFYSEPAKVYSQPAKVYGEPAKTYWPHAAAVATTSNTSSTTTTTTTTAAPSVKAPAYAARRPAVVSRIAFGEAQSSTAAPTNTDNEPQMPSPTAAHYQPHRQYGHSHAQSHTLTNPSTSSQSQSQPQTQIQSRRVLFNLDKLPYDLLNAPAQSSKHLLDPDLPSSPPAAVTYSSPRQRQCLESAFSASLSQSATQHQQLLQQQRQHSSLSDQHSNQNAKGLPNRDLVKCVSKYSQLAAPAAPHTTESSHIDELYTPTPEQNYEIEESVSVMTNGRAHGVQGIHGPTTATPATKAAAGRPAKVPTRMRFGGAGGRLHHYNANTNANVNADASLHEAGRPADHSYDDGDEGSEDVGDGIAEGAVDVDAGDGDGDGDDADAAAGNKSNHGGNGNDGDDDDDSKVAYVVEGRNYRKYRVEEKTDDGFIVGEYGVVDHNDGNLRGVRYTADSTINRSLIQKALLTFLKLK